MWRALAHGYLATIAEAFVLKEQRPFLMALPGKKVSDIPPKLRNDHDKEYRIFLANFFRVDGKLKWHARRLVESEDEWEWAEDPDADYEDTIIYSIAELYEDTRRGEYPFTEECSWESAAYAASHIQDLMVRRINTRCIGNILEWDAKQQQERSTLLPNHEYEIDATEEIEEESSLSQKCWDLMNRTPELERHRLTVRIVKAAIGCQSTATVFKLPAWKEEMARRAREGISTRGRRKRTVPLTREMEAMIGKDDPDIAALIEHGTVEKFARCSPPQENNSPRKITQVESATDVT